MSTNALLNDDQKMLVEGAGRYARSVYSAAARSAAMAEPEGFARQRWAEFADMGWLGLGLPEELGGVYGAEEVAILLDAIGGALVVEPFLDNVVLCGPLLAAHGSVEQRALVSSMIKGNTQFAFAAAEARSRYDLFDVATTVERTAQGFVLAGEKHLVACGDSADYLLVLARDKAMPAANARDGLFLLLVQRQTSGVSTRGYRTYDGRRCADVVFDKVGLPPSAMVGTAGAAWPVVEAACDRMHVALAAEAAGVMQTVLDMTTEYARTRKQFGRPIVANQVYQHRLVDVYVHVEEARSLALYAAAMLEEDQATRARWASGAKAYVSAVGRKVGEEGVQLHGAIGMTEEYAVGGLYKRLAAIANQYGDAEWHYRRIRDLADAQAVNDMDEVNL